jgi:hypothetical protein
MESKFYNLIKANSKRVNINYAQGSDIWDSLMLFIKNTMLDSNIQEPDTYKSVFINHLGTFYPNMSKVNKVSEKIKQIEYEENKELVQVHEELSPDICKDFKGTDLEERSSESYI